MVADQDGGSIAYHLCVEDWDVSEKVVAIDGMRHKLLF